MDEKEVLAIQEENQRLKNLLETEKQEKQKLEENVRNQNSYITKLEADRKNGAQGTPQALDPATKAYLQKKMREDTIASSLGKLAPQFPAGVIGALREDLDKFLDATMKPENTTETYVTQAFYLCYGKAMANTEHAVYKIIAGTNPVNQNPAAQPIPGQQPGTPLPSERLQAFQKPPVMNPNPTMVPKDGGVTPPVVPGAQGDAPRNTKEALDRFKQTLGGLK